MPWSPSDASRHTKKAKGGSLAKLWSEVANRQLGKTGSEASAVRVANYVVKKKASRGRA